MATIGKIGSRYFVFARRLGAMLCGLSLWLLPPRAQGAAGGDLDELHALQRAAIKEAHLDEQSRRGLTARLRLAPLLPQLRVSVGRGWQWSYSTSTSYQAPTPAPSDDRMSYAVAASWDLGRLLFSHEETALRRDAQRTALMRTQLRLQVARLYALRCRALSEATTATSALVSAQRQARVMTLEVALGALTGDEHIGRKLHGCAAAFGSSAVELEALTTTQLSPKLGPAAPAALSDERTTDALTDVGLPDPEAG
jgi:hypothetical protein